MTWTVGLLNSLATTDAMAGGTGLTAGLRLASACGRRFSNGNEGLAMSAVIEIPTAVRHDVDAANRVLEIIAPTTRIERRKGGWYVTWIGWRDKPMSRRWVTRGQSFYPMWSRHWGHGGTCTTALSQLVRWCAGRPVLPMSTWRHWTSVTVSMGGTRGPEIIQILYEAGYPESVDCVLCGKEIVGGLDWWCLDGVSGPCCGWTTGCRQRPAAPAGN